MARNRKHIKKFVMKNQKNVNMKKGKEFDYYIITSNGKIYFNINYEYIKDNLSDDIWNYNVINKCSDLVRLKRLYLSVGMYILKRKHGYFLIVVLDDPFYGYPEYIIFDNNTDEIAEI